MDTWIASINHAPIGFIAINKHNQYTAEIHVMGILEDHHNKKIGSQLIQKASDSLSKPIEIRRENCKWT